MKYFKTYSTFINEAQNWDSVAKVIDNALKKADVTMSYARDYVKSLEKLAKRDAKKFFADYGDYTEDDFIEDVEYSSRNESTVNEFGPLAGSGNADELMGMKRKASKKSENGQSVYVVRSKSGKYKLSKYEEEGNTLAAYFNGMQQELDESTITEEDYVAEYTEHIGMELDSLIAITTAIAISARLVAMPDSKLALLWDGTKALASASWETLKSYGYAIKRELPIIGPKLKQKEQDVAKAKVEVARVEKMKVDIEDYIANKMTDAEIVEIFASDRSLLMSLKRGGRGASSTAFYNTIKKYINGSTKGKTPQPIINLMKKVKLKEILVECAGIELDIKESVVNEARSKLSIASELVKITLKMEKLAKEFNRNPDADRSEAIKTELRDLNPKAESLVAALEESTVNEASLSKVYNAAKKGSYPITLVAIENGKVVDQKIVGAREIVPAAFNDMQKEFPQAQVNIEDRTGKILFKEANLTGGQLESYSDEQRMELADKGFALSDGSYPIKNLQDLKNAIMAYGRAKDQPRTAKFIVKRAKALHADDLIPDTADFQKSIKESINEDNELSKLFQMSKHADIRMGEDKLYKLAMAWESWNVDNDDKYDRLVDGLFTAVELIQNNNSADERRAKGILKKFNKDIVRAMGLHNESIEEGEAYKSASRNELAQYIINLQDEIKAYKQRGNKKYAEGSARDLEEVRAELASRK